MHEDDTESVRMLPHQLSVNKSLSYRLVLGQRKVDEKSNEISAIPELLKLLEIRGCLISLQPLGLRLKLSPSPMNG